MSSTADPVLSVRHLKKYFLVKKNLFHVNSYVKAVDDLSLDVMPGETVGLVGESGCGKSTLARTLMRIYEPDDGAILYKGEDIAHLNNRRMYPVRKKMQMIFQDPYSSLDPRDTVEEIISEPMEIHSMYTARERREVVKTLLDQVGLKPDHINRYPFEFSGGQRQRIGIARTLALDPDFIICDEPISALDVSIQAQILNLLKKVQEERAISYLFIAHDLTMVRHISDKIGVMYLGRLVEFGDADEVYNNPLHPYTKALMSAAPIADPRKARSKKRIKLEGEIPSPINVPRGCPFSSRCPDCRIECKLMPPAVAIEGTRRVSCYNYL